MRTVRLNPSKFDYNKAGQVDIVEGLMSIVVRKWHVFHVDNVGSWVIAGPILQSSASFFNPLD